MKVNITLDVDDSLVKHLKLALEIEDDNRVTDAIVKNATAAVTEYHEMFLGQKVFRRGSDLMEYRLVLLTQHLFDCKIPDERKVSALFQMTSTESRSLIRSVISKYQHKLSHILDETLRESIKKAQPDAANSIYTLPINNRNVVDHLNLILASIDPTLPPIGRKRNTIATYEIRNSSLKKLQDHLEV